MMYNCHYNCRCVLVEQLCAAERLLHVADKVMRVKDRLVTGTALGPEHFAFAAVAIKLRANKALTLRAITENWTHERIVRELY